MGGKVCKIYQKKYRAENKDKQKAYMKKYYRENKKKLREAHKKRYEDNKEEASEYSKKYREDNIEELKIKKMKYYQDNKKTIHKQIRNRINSDPLLKVKDRVRGLIKSSIKRKGYSKKSKTYDIVQCQKEDLMLHLIKTFESNYKIKWDDSFLSLVHIDHIIPTSSAKSEEELYSLSHYSNLQFLYCSDNISKGGKLDWKLDLTKTGLYSRIEEEKINADTKSKERY